MNKVARLLLFIMLAVSLPFHSAYAVGMAQCMALQHESGPMEEIASHAEHGSPGEHDHSRHTERASPPGDDGASAGAHCGSCSACATAAAITGRAPTGIVDGSVAAHPFFFERRLVSAAVSPLDRPPLAP